MNSTCRGSRWGSFVSGALLVSSLVSFLGACAEDADGGMADVRADDLGVGPEVAGSSLLLDIADGFAVEVSAPQPDVGVANEVAAPLGDSGQGGADSSVGVDLGLPDATQADIGTTSDIAQEDAPVGPDGAVEVAIEDFADTFVPPGPTPACRGADPRTWQDLSGFGHHGTFYELDEAAFWGGEGTVESPFSFELGGTPHPRVELPDAGALRLQSGSVEFWLRPASTTFANKMVYNHRDSGSIAGVVLISQNGQWKGLGTNVDNRWATAFAAPGHQVGLWQHVVLTWQLHDASTTMRLFVDGVETGTSTIPGAVLYGPKGRPQIGGLNGGNGSFYGGIALARIWGGALSAAEVRGLFNEAAAERFGRFPLAGDVVAPVPALLAWFDASPCE